MRLIRILLIGMAAVVLLLAATIIYVMSIDFDGYRPLLAAQVKAATGHDIAIGGHLDLKLSLTPTLAVNDVRVANTPGFSRPDMATIARLEAQIALLPLLSRRLQIERFMLTGADIALETDAQGRGNWRLGATEAAAPSAAPDRLLTLAVGAGTIPESRLTYRKQNGRAPPQLAVGPLARHERSGGSPGNAGGDEAAPQRDARCRAPRPRRCYRTGDVEPAAAARRPRLFGRAAALRCAQIG